MLPTFSMPMNAITIFKDLKRIFIGYWVKHRTPALLSPESSFIKEMVDSAIEQTGEWLARHPAWGGLIT